MIRPLCIYLLRGCSVIYFEPKMVHIWKLENITYSNSKQVRFLKCLLKIIFTFKNLSVEIAYFHSKKVNCVLYIGGMNEPLQGNGK